MSREMPMTDARLDRTAAAWQAEYQAWGMRRDKAQSRFEIVRSSQPGGAVDEEGCTIFMTIALTREFPRADAEAWLNTYRNRAAARAALEAAIAPTPRKRKRRTDG